MKVSIYQTHQSELVSQEGNIESRTVFVVKDGTYDETSKAVLGKLTAALKLTPEDYKVLVVKSGVFDIVGNNADKLIVFGFTANELSSNLKLPIYYNIPMESFSLLISESIPEMNANRDKKLKLWGQLQKMFGLA